MHQKKGTVSAMAITRNALFTFAFTLTVAASACTAAAGAAKEMMAPANLKPEAARGFERLKGVEITDGEITAVDYGKSGLRVAFVLPVRSRIAPEEIRTEPP